MGQIFVEGLGTVEIAGDKPTEKESAAISRAYRQKKESGELLGSSEFSAPAKEPAPPAPIPPVQVPQQMTESAQGPGLAEATGGWISRPSMEMLLGTGGSFIGGAAGTPAGPAGVAGGAVAGGALGTAAGSLLYDTLDEGYRYFADEPSKYAGDAAFGPSKQAAEDLKTDLLISGGLTALGPAFKAVVPGIGKMLGARNPEAERMTKLSTARDVPLGPAALSKHRLVRGATRVLGVFPFAGGPVRKATEATEEGLVKFWDDTLSELAPGATMYELGENMTEAASSRFDKFRRISGALYDRFYNLADNASVKDIIPTYKARGAANELVGQRSAEKITLADGTELTDELAEGMNKFVEDLEKLPGAITAQQYRGLQKRLNNLIGKAQIENVDYSALNKIKAALEQDMNSPLVDKLTEGEGRQIMNALTRANSFFTRAIRSFETPTAKQFGRVDRNIFSPKFQQFGNLNPDEVFRVAFNTKSPKALADLRELVGPRIFQQGARHTFEKIMEKSWKRSKATDQMVFDADKFEELLGLKGEKSAILDELLKGAKVDKDQIQQFVDLAKASSAFTVPDVSTFLQRRITLGGLAALAGSATAGASGPVSTAAAILGLRYFGKLISSPRAMRAFNESIKDDLPSIARRNALMRAITVLQEETPESEQREQGGGTMQQLLMEAGRNPELRQQLQSVSPPAEEDVLPIGSTP